MINQNQRILTTRYLLQFILIATTVIGIYGSFLSSPPVFDDVDFFKNAHRDVLQDIFSFNLRWLPYATFEWTRGLLGEDIIWLRLGNLALHIGNSFLLLLFLHRLFTNTLRDHKNTTHPPPFALGLSPSWLAFFGALMFAMHPAAVYGVAYLVQRSILMATMFSLLTWLLFLEGLLRNRRWWLVASAVTYLLATFSKEHAIMVPAVSCALMLLIQKPSRQLFTRIWPVFMLYGLIGALIIFQVKSGRVIGHAYEPNSVTMLSSLHIDAQDYHPLSIQTQCLLYFKYLLLWLFPNTAWMSVDIRESFSSHLWEWPETAGVAGFILYAGLAFGLLMRRGRAGLLGFAILCPWLLFLVELSTVRIQEIFVIYRSYLWMPCMTAALPFLFQKLAPKYSITILTAITLLLVPLTWNRLTTFSDPVLLWDEALRLAQNKENPTGLGRMYHNRGVAYLSQKRYQEAILDFNMGLKLLPTHSMLYNDRAVAYLETGRYMDALNDYDSAIWFNPGYYNPYLGRAKVYEALGNQAAALRDYEQSCRMGVKEVCSKQ